MPELDRVSREDCKRRRRSRRLQAACIWPSAYRPNGRDSFHPSRRWTERQKYGAKTIQGLLGEYVHAADASLLISAKERGGATPEIVALKGKRAVFINETNKSDHLNESRVKYLAGDDMLSGRDLYEKPSISGRRTRQSCGQIISRRYGEPTSGSGAESIMCRTA